MSRSVSLFFYAGDFDEVMRREAQGQAHEYATHPHVARLVNRLADDDWTVRVYSFRNASFSEDRPRERVHTVKLAGKAYDDDKTLVDAVLADNSDILVPHFPNTALLRACLDRGKPVMLGMANSYNRTGLRGFKDRFVVRKALSDKRIGLIANHCWPSTAALERIGISPDRLVPWDIPKVRDPISVPPKNLPGEGTPLLAYVGAISAEKGVGDIISAVAILKARGVDVVLQIAGAGEIEAMRDLASRKGVSENVVFLGKISNDDVNDLFERASIALIPSQHRFPEGLPLTFFEAIASRTPVITSDHPMLRAVTEGIDGTHAFPEKDAEKCADLIAMLLADAREYHKASLAATQVWDRLNLSADWGTLLWEFINNGPSSGWIDRHKWSRLKLHLKDRM